MELIIILALLIFIALREVMNFIERRDMLNRLMAKDYPEYKQLDDVTPNNLEPADDGTVDIEGARKDLYGEEE